MTAFRCGGFTVIAVRLHVPRVGPWHADLDFELAPDVSGRQVLELGALQLTGTIDSARSGTHAGQRRLRLVAGAGRWGAELPRRAYHTDAGVLALTVAQDAAREAGEQLDAAAAPSASRLAADYVRTVGPASRALEEAVGSALWWVAYDGTTHVGQRAEAEAARGSYEVLGYDPLNRTVTGAMDDLSAVGIGSILVDRLDEPQAVRELEIEATPAGIRFYAWTGGSSSTRGRLGDALRNVVARMTDRPVTGLYRYRVVQRSGDRLELQALRPDLVPDILPISMWPGVAGAHAEVTPGTLVVVQFLEGDRTLPIVTHFEGKDGAGWTPVNLTFDAASLIKLGAAAASFAAKADLVSARVDALQQKIDTHVHLAGSLVAAGPLTVTGSTAAIADPIGSLAGVACEKVKIQ